MEVCENRIVPYNDSLFNFPAIHCIVTIPFITYSTFVTQFYSAYIRKFIIYTSLYFILFSIYNSSSSLSKLEKARARQKLCLTRAFSFAY